MALDKVKIKGLFNRVYNSTSETIKEEDKVDLVEYSKKVFGDLGSNPDPSLLNQFNNLIVEQANEIAKPRITDMISLLANVQTKKRGDVVHIQIPQKNKIKFFWSANGSGVDLKRVGGKKSILAQENTMTMGIYYEPLDFVTDPSMELPNLINKIADAKVEMYLKEISKLTADAVTSGTIPTANVLSGSNITYANYNKLASVLMRFGGQPIFVADTLLIDHIAGQIATTQTSIISDDMKNELLTALVPTRLGRTTAVNLINPFINENNDSVELPVNVGYMFAGGVSQKPFSIVEFGGLSQKLEQNMEDERVKLKVVQKADILLMFGEALGYVKDDSILL